MKTRITVIMGIFNCERTLEEAINSIIAQTYTGWRLVLCDDGSSDKSYDIANGFVDRYPEKIILIRNQKNKGLNYTLNRCLKYAATEYVARMDGDDISLPNRLEKEMEFLDQNHEYDLCSTPMIHFDEKGIYRVGTGHGEPTKEQYVKATPFCHATCMVRLNAYKMVNGYSEKRSRMRVEDWDLWIRMREKEIRGFVLKEPLYMMRDDRNALARRKLRYRLNEAKVSYMAIRRLRVSPAYLVWVFRPIIVGLMPPCIYSFFHRRKK